MYQGEFLCFDVSCSVMKYWVSQKVPTFDHSWHHNPKLAGLEWIKFSFTALRLKSFCNFLVFWEQQKYRWTGLCGKLMVAKMPEKGLKYLIKIRTTLLVQKNKGSRIFHERYPLHIYCHGIEKTYICVWNRMADNSLGDGWNGLADCFRLGVP